MQAQQKDPSAAPAAEAAEAENNRDRVRRLLFDPLGFRHPRQVDPELGRSILNRIADDLRYMHDEGLAALRDCLLTKGEGSKRNFWPDRATFLNFAEIIEKRPLSDLPGLSSWFGSIEGPKAEAQGILVETFLFIADRKMPPVTDGARRQVAERAADNARRLQIVAERRKADLPIQAEDLAFERWYQDQLQVCRDMMRAEREKRGHADG